MDLGMIGLGRMGENPVRRSLRDDQRVVPHHERAASK
jgi:6-phosphogluconate dehydrogenase (decarboxylating)